MTGKPAGGGARGNPGLRKGRGLREELATVFGAGAEAPLPEERFRELALRVFRHQYEGNPVYRHFCRRRGAEPGRVGRWEEAPPVPTRAFKELALVTGDPAVAERVFRTSGTTGGRRRRGAHHVMDLSLYRASLLPNFRAHLLPDDASLPFLSLIPSAGALPDSSLSYMVEVAARRFAAPGGGWFVDAGGTIDQEGLAATLEGADEAGRPVLLLGTAFAFVHWLDALEEAGRAFRLPPGSRIMETGGFKGRSREVPREELYRRMEDRLGVPDSHIVNEYGMTELLSQFYEPVLRVRLAGGGSVSGEKGDPGGGKGGGERSDVGDGAVAGRRHRPPPWVRTRVLDPGTLEPLPEGRPGLLAHFDLANLDSVAHVLTEDLGVAVEDGFRVLGRAAGAEPRGCSAAMDELLSAGAGRRGGPAEG